MPNVVELIQNNPELSLVNEILEAGNYKDELKNMKDVTIFVPNNEAVNQQLTQSQTTKEKLLENKDRLRQILEFHIVPNQLIWSKDVKEDMQATTKGGNVIDLSNENDTFFVNGMNVLLRDQAADNGVVHVINRVLIPPVQNN